jgi:hypothetical protein
MRLRLRTVAILCKDSNVDSHPIKWDDFTEYLKPRQEDFYSVELGAARRLTLNRISEEEGVRIICMFWIQYLSAGCFQYGTIMKFRVPCTADNFLTRL